MVMEDNELCRSGMGVWTMGVGLFCRYCGMAADHTEAEATQTPGGPCVGSNRLGGCGRSVCYGTGAQKWPGHHCSPFQTWECIC